MPGILTIASVAALAALSSFITPSIRHELKVLGVGRTVPVSTIDYVKIQDTIHCEDLHYYAPANLLFTACEDRYTRFGWFPPLGNFEPPKEGVQGSFHVVDPETKKSIRLSFLNFESTFITHGIDVIPDPTSPKTAVYIFAINHFPNPEFVASRREHITKSHSRVELFRHVIGSSTLKHIRTISHEKIETPNDIFAVSSTEFWVTNDHFYREGLMREVETIAPTKWSSVVHVSITDLTATDSAGLKVNTALTGIKNNNGLGHVYESGEVTVVSAERGILYRCSANPGNGTLKVEEKIHLDSTLDNPSWYHDTWATADDDKSGYVLAGLARGIDLAGHARDPTAKDPAYVWLVQRQASTHNTQDTKEAQTEGEWSKRLVFADDGAKLRTASAAVIVGIDPKKEGGKKRGWLFVTGFMSENMVATKIDL